MEERSLKLHPQKPISEGDQDDIRSYAQVKIKGESVLLYNSEKCMDTLLVESLAASTHMSPMCAEGLGFKARSRQSRLRIPSVRGRQNE